MGLKEHNPGCLCCGCKSASDDFNRANSTDLGGSWTEAAGNWDINGNLLRITTASAIVLSTTVITVSKRVKISVLAKSSASGDLVRLILDYQDSSNYHFAEARISGATGYLRIYRRLAGVETQLATTTFTYNINTPLILNACISGSTMQAIVLTNPTTAASRAISANITPFDSGTFGLGTGGTVTGTVNFDDFTAEEVSEECADCCYGCLSTLPACCVNDCNWPEEIDIDMTSTNWIDLNGSGCNCDILEAVFTLTRSSTLNECFWSYQDDSFCTVGSDAYRLTIIIVVGNSPTDCHWVATIRFTNLTTMNFTSVVFRDVIFGGCDISAARTLTFNSGTGDICHHLSGTTITIQDAA